MRLERARHLFVSRRTRDRRAGAARPPDAPVAPFTSTVSPAARRGRDGARERRDGRVGGARGAGATITRATADEQVSRALEAHFRARVGVGPAFLWVARSRSCPLAGATQPTSAWSGVLAAICTDSGYDPRRS
ncbi:hypothetical protein CF641_37245, partial [Burkholderia pseudomallei]|uniref:hypothetical protein n=1 Tax=Burkholderia pseudomallei TaxID=28450 RepID=UPI000CCFA48C